MATFPASLDPSPRSRIRKDAGLRTYRTSGGQIRGRQAYSETVYKLRLVYEFLTDTEVDLITAHFNAGPASDHTVGVDSDTYDVNYLNDPGISAYHGILRTVTVDFEGKKQ